MTTAEKMKKLVEKEEELKKRIEGYKSKIDTCETELDSIKAKKDKLLLESELAECRNLNNVIKAGNISMDELKVLIEKINSQSVPISDLLDAIS